ncbi:hypothetical protein SRHO_G00253030 [Serrasalmus rhombeus]
MRARSRNHAPVVQRQIGKDPGDPDHPQLIRNSGDLRPHGVGKQRGAVGRGNSCPPPCTTDVQAQQCLRADTSTGQRQPREAATPAPNDRPVPPPGRVHQTGV